MAWTLQNIWDGESGTRDVWVNPETGERSDTDPRPQYATQGGSQMITTQGETGPSVNFLGSDSKSYNFDMDTAARIFDSTQGSLEQKIAAVFQATGAGSDVFTWLQQSGRATNAELRANPLIQQMEADGYKLLPDGQFRDEENRFGNLGDVLGDTARIGSMALSGMALAPYLGLGGGELTGLEGATGGTEYGLGEAFGGMASPEAVAGGAAIASPAGSLVGSLGTAAEQAAVGQTAATPVEALNPPQGIDISTPSAGPDVSNSGMDFGGPGVEAPVQSPQLTPSPQAVPPVDAGVGGSPNPPGSFTTDPITGDVVSTAGQGTVPGAVGTVGGPAAAAVGAAGAASAFPSASNWLAQQTGLDPGLLSLLGIGASTGLGLYGANQQADAYRDVAGQEDARIREMMGFGAPYRQRLQDLYTNPNQFLTSPEVTTPVQQGTDIMARALSVKGNPTGDANSLQQLQNYSANQLFAQLGKEKERLAGFGGLTQFAGGAAQGPNINPAMAGVGAETGKWNAIGSGIANATQPRLADYFARGIV